MALRPIIGVGGGQELIDHPQLLAFRAEGILGGKTYHLDIGKSASIIVGPNGTGKSTFLSLFYLFLSRQWSRLSELEFERLTLVHSAGEISISRSDILSLEALAPRSSPRMRHYVARLVERNELDRLFKANLTKADRELISDLLQIPSTEVAYLRRYISREIGLSAEALTVDSRLKSLGIGRVLYLPTYRRIEKDIQSIFPDIEDRIRSRIQETQITAREDVSFKEIVSFGMQDVEKIISLFVSSVKEFQRISNETASQEYIRDIVRGKVSTYSLKGLRDLSDDELTDFIQRLDTQLFTTKDRDALTTQIEEIRKRHKGQPNKDMRYLAFYVEKLLAAHRRVKAQEKPLLDFGKYVSSYLGKNKDVSYTNLDFVISDVETGGEILLHHLSSGEKQVISIFAYLLLAKETDFIVFIDEPELSLSVPWQKKFLIDIINTGNCRNLFTVTHSPFVFDNDLRKNVIDVSRLSA